MIIKNFKSIGKFIPILFLVTFLALLLSACDNNLFKNQIEPIVYFCSKFCASNQGDFIEGNLNIEKDGNIKLEISAPPQSKGLTFSKLNNDIIISFNGLSMKFDDKILPESSYVSTIFEVLDCIKSKNNYNLISNENSISTFVGKYNNFDFEFKIDNSNGFIKEINIPKKNINFTLSEHKK